MSSPNHVAASVFCFGLGFLFFLHVFQVISISKKKSKFHHCFRRKELAVVAKAEKKASKDRLYLGWLSMSASLACFSHNNLGF